MEIPRKNMEELQGSEELAQAKKDKAITWAKRHSNLMDEYKLAAKELMIQIFKAKRVEDQASNFAKAIEYATKKAKEDA